MTDNSVSSSSTIGVIGAGTMGAGIAQVAASAGHYTLVFDENPEMLDKARINLKLNLKKLSDKGKISTEESEKIFSRLQFAGSLDEFKNCHLVIEAIIEDLSAKQKLFRFMEEKTNAVLATNTSSLSVTSIAGTCLHPERVLGLHFFNPAPLMPLVEIIPGLSGSEKITADVSALIRGWNKTVVLAKDTPGFIVNRLARSFYGESLRIYEEGYFNLPTGERGFATIDWALREFGGFKMGPFELMDLIGNDINYKVTETVWSQFYFDGRYKPSLTQKRMVEAGRLGRKSGEGYYRYSENATAAEPMKDEVIGKKIFQRVLAMLINEAVDALHLGVASAEDIDLAMTKGVNYPKGLLKLCDELGAGTVLDTIRDLRNEYEEDRYRPSVLLKQLAGTGKKIFS